MGKVFGSRERAYYLGVNAYFGPIRTNRTHARPNYVHEESKFEVDYHRQTYCSPEKVAHIRRNWKKQVKK